MSVHFKKNLHLAIVFCLQCVFRSLQQTAPGQWYLSGESEERISSLFCAVPCSVTVPSRGHKFMRDSNRSTSCVLYPPAQFTVRRFIQSILCVFYLRGVLLYHGWDGRDTKHDLSDSSFSGLTRFLGPLRRENPPSPKWPTLFSLLLSLLNPLYREP